MLKKISATILAVAIVAAMSTNVFAGSYESTTLGGKTMTASCSVSSSSGSATTTFDAIAGIVATVRYDYNYGYNQANFRQVTRTNSNASTSVTAYATSNSGDSNVVSVRSVGTHSVSYNGGSQSLYTNT